MLLKWRVEKWQNSNQLSRKKWNFIVKTLETNIFMQKKSDFCKIISLRKEELMFSPDTNEPAKEVFCAKILHNRFPFKLKRCSGDELIFKFRISNGPRLSGTKELCVLTSNEAVQL